ncbi:LacI family DNA-binding transcriptional regulator [Cognatiyoonia sediminum]|nr:substrate-binding domain-containing protein [Cognatiyoonia sediminum]
MNLKELSETLGLSQTTVSRALNGYPEVSEATRTRVEMAARKFNYSPSSRAKGLATGKALAIGHVIPTRSKHEMVNPVFGDFIAGAGEIYAQNGYEMILSIVNADASEETVYRGLQSRRAVDGVVVHGPRMADDRIPLLNEIGLPFVVHGRASEISEPYEWLDVNNKHAFERATQFLIDLGHRRIALINGLEVMDFARRRRLGYEAALNSEDLDIDESLIFSEEMTEEYGYETTRTILDRSDAPTAVVASSMIIALGVRRAIEERGLVMGKDLSIVTHDDMLSYLQNGGDVPIFTATRSSVREAGRKAAEMLLQKISNPTTPPQNILFEAELTVGRSTGPAPN